MWRQSILIFIWLIYKTDLKLRIIEHYINFHTTYNIKVQMDDLKNLVIQTLEEEGTLGTLRAQLRSRVFKAIEKNAEPAAKQAAGFQWQNPAAQKVHESEESRLIAQMVKEYLDFYRMEYTLSVYTPEAALQNE